MNDPNDETPTEPADTPVSMDPVVESPRPVIVVDPAPDLDIFGRAAPKGQTWSHRRGEPRIFAFCWTLYLLVATIAAFLSVGSPGSNDPLALRLAARAVLAAMTVGVALLWPMTRLSQELPGRRVGRVSRVVGQDLIVLLVPAQAIIWPQVAMAAWPVSVVAALSLSLTVWAVLIGAVLAFALMLSEQRRGWWMLVVVALIGFGPLIALAPLGSVAHGNDSFDWWWMTSPLTSGFEITRDRPWSGAPAAVESGHWWAVGAVGALGLIGWVGVWALGLLRRREHA